MVAFEDCVVKRREVLLAACIKVKGRGHVLLVMLKCEEKRVLLVLLYGDMERCQPVVINMVERDLLLG